MPLARAGCREGGTAVGAAQQAGGDGVTAAGLRPGGGGPTGRAAGPCSSSSPAGPARPPGPTPAGGGQREAPRDAGTVRTGAGPHVRPGRAVPASLPADAEPERRPQRTLDLLLMR
ncbi:hypothetical protein GCM10010451_63440 [Streptomyces virens]|uniref:Uncharacterized protein n=1 Tax=Streptomyces virens TaxID=285572 RepID=A0ABP6Q4F6_9ACTN